MSTVSKLEKEAKLGQALGVLSNRYRRELLLALLVENPQDDDNRDPLNVVESPLEPEVLEVELYHKHLPKLEEQGFIQWNRETGKISKGPDWDDIEPVLRLIERHREELPDDWL